ncbi:MAG: 4'-phosphopantetheinyl transferase family protein [Blastocatellia bacterium]
MAHKRINPGLGANMVNVWWVPLDAPPEQEAEVRRLLCAEEEARARCLARPVDRRRFAVSHAALRSILGHTLGRAPADLRFDAEAYGKPRLVDLPLHFTLSHSWEWAVVAVADRSLGVDLERLAPLPEMESLIDRFFSPRERALLGALPAAERPRGFYRCWCGKEAYLKALGLGLSMDTTSFSIYPSGDPSAPGLLDSPASEKECRRWRLHSLDAPRGYVAALAIEEPRPSIAEHRFSFAKYGSCPAISSAPFPI